MPTILGALVRVESRVTAGLLPSPQRLDTIRQAAGRVVSLRRARVADGALEILVLRGLRAPRRQSRVVAADSSCLRPDVGGADVPVNDAAAKIRRCIVEIGERLL